MQLVLANEEKENNKAAFDFLLAREEQIEQAYGASLKWERQDDKKQSCVGEDFDIGGYRSNREEWHGIQDKMTDAMRRLSEAFKQHINELRGRKANAR